MLQLFYCHLSSQNYVPNPSFEGITSCPDNFYQIYKATPWFSPYCETTLVGNHGNAVLFSSSIPCNYQLAAVPRNVWYVLDAHSGVSYGGIIVMSAKQLYTEFREYLETKLTKPLEAGSKYYFSMFYCLPEGDYYNPASKDICYNSSATGVYFSENVVDNNPACEPLQLSPQIKLGNTQINPESKWHELSGCYTATGNEQYITIGNFAKNIVRDCTGIDTVGYYLMVDDVALIASVNKQTDTVICTGKVLDINAQTFRNEYYYLGGWQYKWSDGDTRRQRKITAPGDYLLTVTNKNCFED